MATKITLKQLGPDILALLGGSGGGSLTKDITSNITVGAAAAGTLFPSGQSLTEFAEAILLKDVIPVIATEFSGSGMKEIGNVINGTTMKLTITNLSNVSVPVNKIDFYVNNIVVDSQPFVDGQSLYQFIYNQPIASNTSVKAILTYSGDQTVSGGANFTFVYGSFTGVTSFDSITTTIAESFIDTFNKNIKETKAYTWNNVTLNDQRFCYMYPASMGPLSSIKDGNGFEQISSYDRYQVTVTYPTDGKAVSYYAYLLRDSVTGSGFKQIYS